MHVSTLHQPAIAGLQTRSGERQAMPSISIARCAGESVIVPPVSYIRGHTKDAGDNGYVLALAANALAAYDAKDDSTLEVLQRLDKRRKEIPEWKAANFPTKVTSLTYSRGDGVTIETTPN